MRQTILSSPRCQWIDIVAPTDEELRLVASDYHIHPVLLADCLDPKHLPKIEMTSGCLFTILRSFDEEATDEMQSVQQLTRKLVIVIKDGVLLTIHRKTLPFLTQYAASAQAAEKELACTRLYFEICKSAIMTYDLAFVGFEERFEKTQELVASGKGSVELFAQVRHEGRRLSTIKRLLWHTISVFQRSPREDDQERLYSHDLVESVQSLIFFSDELAEDANGLVNLELSMYAHRNNQVIRVLTLFSVFFMPLTFIVGVYGMNFKVMPELEWRFGYAAVWGLMLFTSLAIWWWFKKRRWFDD